jgi:hypothetical protein
VPTSFGRLQSAKKSLQSHSTGKRKLPFVVCFSCLPPLCFFVDAVSQRVPNVPSAFLSTKHRWLVGQIMA